MAPQRRKRRRDPIDDIFEELLNMAASGGGADVVHDFRSAVHEAVAKGAEALGFETPQFAKDRGAFVPPGFTPPPPADTPRTRARYESIGPSHYLVYHVANVNGRPKLEWEVLKADDPDVSVDKLVDEYLTDHSALGLLIFQGSLVFRDMKRVPGTGGSEGP